MHNSVRDLMIMRSLGLAPKIRMPDDVVECYWASPPQTWAKVNTDGSARGNPGISGWGAVIRDSNGEVKATGIGGLGILSPFEAECVAIIKGTDKAMDMGYNDIWIESDCAAAVKAFHSGKVHWRVKREWERISQANKNVLISVNKREVNFAADLCSKKGAMLTHGGWGSRHSTWPWKTSVALIIDLYLVKNSYCTLALSEWGASHS
ncbi:hypothetical protein ACHQM5_016213 [Ranunculus cassubicifolius]